MAHDNSSTGNSSTGSSSTSRGSTGGPASVAGPAGPGASPGVGSSRGGSGNPKRGAAAPSTLSILIALVGVLALLFSGVWTWVTLSAGQRDSRAIQRMVSDEKAWWNTRKPAVAAETGTGKKKGKKKKTAAPAAVVPAGGITPVLELKGRVRTAEIKEQNRQLHEHLGSYFPSDPYIIVDTANNHLYMKKGQEILLDALCSTGSYSKLDSPDGRSWFFHTPRGQFRVQRKIKEPIWVKPDWAFVEENEPIPGARHPDRYEPYVMGDYALAFGNGYYIHGTLYRRLLGQSVTHGCIRLGDQELESVFKTATIGTPIFIY